MYDRPNHLKDIYSEGYFQIWTDQRNRVLIFGDTSTDEVFVLMYCNSDDFPIMHSKSFNLDVHSRFVKDPYMTFESPNAYLIYVKSGAASFLRSKQFRKALECALPMLNSPSEIQAYAIPPSIYKTVIERCEKDIEGIEYPDCLGARYACRMTRLAEQQLFYNQKYPDLFYLVTGNYYDNLKDNSKTYSYTMNKYGIRKES